MHPMTRHRTVAAGLAATLFLPPVAGTAASPDTGPDPQDPTPVQRSLLAAAEQAAIAQTQAERNQEGRSDGATAYRTPGAPDEDLDDTLQGLVDDGAVAVSARVETPERTWRGASGVREQARPAPARSHDRFRVASITKAMVATLVLQVVEKGTWSVDTRVDTVLPGVFPDHPQVTVEHLLSHRSGAPTGTDMLLAARIEDPTSVAELFAVLGEDYADEEHVAAALATPWLAEPGTAFSYSNSGYVVLGMMLEEQTGQSVERLLRERVFRPAGMRYSAYPDESRTLGPFLSEAAWTGESEGGWWSLADFDPDVFSHAGAATSTTADLNRFTEALVTGDLLEQETVDDMLTPRSDGPLEYGLGAYRLPDPCAGPEDEDPYLYGHDGATFGTLSIAFTSPDGERQVSLGVTGRNLSADPEALYNLDDALVPLLLATC